MRSPNARWVPRKGDVGYEAEVVTTLRVTPIVVHTNAPPTVNLH
jgi:hypothetical protein